MTKAQIVLYFCLAFILGIALSSFFYFGQLVLLGFLILAVFFISVFWKYPEGKPSASYGASKNFVILGFCILFLVLGIVRYQVTDKELARPELENLRGQHIAFIGYVEEEPEQRTNKVKLKIKAPKLGTNILVTSYLFPELRYGDKLKIEGVLKQPPEIKGFNYKDYLKKQGIYFLMDYPKIEILARNQGNPIKAILISLKNKLQDSLAKIVSSPQSGFFEALLFGEETNISEEWKEKLNITGTRHIAAVSGMNITIICQLLLSLLLGLGFWRQQAFYVSLLLIFLYVLMIGAPASGVRAAIMGTLLLAAQHSGRLVDPARLIVFALTAMLFFNPLLLKNDVGFQLSFLAVAGLIYLQPFFARIFKKLPDFLDLKLNLSATLAAQVFTLPLLLYNFGQISLVAPITNVLILPAIPYLTMLGFAFSFLGIFSQILGRILAWPCWILLFLIMRIIDFSSQFSLASQNFKINWVFLLISYFVLAIFVWRLREREKLKFLKY